MISVTIERAIYPFHIADKPPCKEAYFENGMWWLDISDLTVLDRLAREEGSLILHSDDHGIFSVTIYDSKVED